MSHETNQASVDTVDRGVLLTEVEDDQDRIDLIPPERRIADLELPDWQNGHWPSSKNVSQ
jgi:hypothetical protein